MVERVYIDNERYPGVLWDNRIILESFGMRPWTKRPELAAQDYLVLYVRPTKGALAHFSHF